MSIVNIAGYKFVELTDLAELKEKFLDKCSELGLSGTILLAPEGTNQMLAGTAEQISAYKAFLAQWPDFADMSFKESLSEEIPFKRLFVKIKQQTIPMDIANMNPLHHSAPYLSPQELKQWYDEGREMLVLDTRNDYEIEVGTFANAQHVNISEFRDFASALEQIDPQWKEKPVVTFCTGGIRCEKAAPLMAEAGFKQVYQLDGGILAYFEQCGGTHYQGNCFVFDERGQLDPQLRPCGEVQN